jgi:hypothetical protein
MQPWILTQGTGMSVEQLVRFNKSHIARLFRDNRMRRAAARWVREERQIVVFAQKSEENAEAEGDCLTEMVRGRAYTCKY